MPSFGRAVVASLGVGSIRSSVPDSVSFSSRKTGVPFLGLFSGWTASLSTSGLEVAALIPLTVFTSSKDTVTCEWIKDQVESYKASDDVFDDLFLEGEHRKYNTTVKKRLTHLSNTAMYIQGASSMD
jgi:hypothetical protein